MIIGGKLSIRQELGLIILYKVNIGSKVALKIFKHTFQLAISLRVVSSGEFDFNSILAVVSILEVASKDTTLV
jgi:hypothetical protein